MTEEKQPIQPIEEPEPSSFRLIITLGIAGFLAGVVLVAVYLYTKPMIAQNKADALREAVYKVLEGTTSFETLVMVDGKLMLTTEAPAEAKPDELPAIYLGRNDQEMLTGFAIPSEAIGFQDVIAVLFGYDPVEKKIIGMEVLESKETPGLGDKIYKDEDFVRQFQSLAVEPSIKAVKPGEKNTDNQVATISGATISSVAVVDILNKGIAQWKEPIAEYLEAKDLQVKNGNP